MRSAPSPPTRSPSSRHSLRLGDCTVDLRRGEARWRDGRLVRLTERERAFLAHLAPRDGVPITREELLTQVWGWSPRAQTRAVDDLVKRLRPKLEPDPATPRYLQTAHGIGYRLVTDRPVVAPSPAVKRQETILLDDVVVDLARAEVRGPTGQHTLSANEIALLRLLLDAAGEPVDSGSLQRRVTGALGGRAVAHAVRRLRQKLEPDPAAPRFLLTLRGKGYALVVPPVDASTDPVAPATGHVRPRSSGLVGRDRLLADLHADMAAGVRAIGLVGPAGSGKTRLARELVADAARSWWVDADGVSTADGLVSAIAAVARRNGSPGALPAGLSGPPLVVVVDRLEALEDAAFLGHWLAAVPTLVLVLVGRRLPACPGLVRHFVGPLARPDARELFEARGRQARPGWSAESGDQLDAVLDHLDDLPLAIELAAARLSLMSLSALLAHLDQDGSLLRRAGDDLGLEAAITQSWQLLGPSARRTLAVMAALPDPPDLDLLEAVSAPDLLDAVQELLDLNLVEHVQAPGDDQLRFRPYGVVRRVADKHLDARARRSVFDALATRLARDIPADAPPDQDLLDALAPRVASVDAALDAALGAAPGADDSTADLRPWALANLRLVLASRHASAPRLDALLDRLRRLPPPPAPVAATVWSAFTLAVASRDPALAATAAALAEASLAHTDAPLALAQVAGTRAMLASHEGRLQDAIAAFDQGAAAATAAGDHLLEARLRTAQAGALRRLGRLDEARAAYRIALERYAVLDAPDHEAVCRLNRAVLLRTLGHFADARADLQQSAEHAQARGLPDVESCARQNLGLMLHELGESRAALRELELAATLAGNRGHRSLEAIALACQGPVLAWLGDREAAWTILLRARAAHVSLHDQRFTAFSDAALASLDPLDGLDRADRAVALLDQLGHHEDHGSCLLVRALLHEQRGALDHAVADLVAAVDRLDGHGDPCGLGRALANLARLQPRRVDAPDRLARARTLAGQLGVLPDSQLARDIALAASAVDAAQAAGAPHKQSS